jgi:two-component system cell cycle response regulator
MAVQDTQSSRRRVLIVDDEASIRLICRINLAASGWMCDEADNGDEAVERIRTEPPDVVLLDVMMPIRDGWMVAEDIIGDPATRDVPIVFVTARAEQRDRERAHSLGAVGYLTKPVNPVGLSAAIDEILRRIEQGEREQLRADLLAGHTHYDG